MFTSGHAQKYASCATSLTYSSVIFTRVSGPGAIARDQLIEGGTSMLIAVVDAFSAIFTSVELLTDQSLLSCRLGHVIERRTRRDERLARHAHLELFEEPSEVSHGPRVIVDWVIRLVFFGIHDQIDD